MSPLDLHSLPKVRDSLSYLYVEHARIEQDDKAVALVDERGRVPVPCASLTVLMMGPGTVITHAAVRTLADCGCQMLWTGEEGVRVYAQGLGETRSARHLLWQAKLVSDPKTRMEVVFRLYEMRFAESLTSSASLQEIRGKEGIRVREAYRQASRETGVEWKGRSYRRDGWEHADPINKALSAANSCLYGVCHAAIVSAGYSPALGFIHTGKMLSFVYDVADLYKTEIATPLAFRQVAAGGPELERRVRQACRSAFHDARLLKRIVPDIDRALGISDPGSEAGLDLDGTDDAPGGLWDPDGNEIAGGVNRGETPPKGSET